MSRVALGDVAAFDALFRRYAPRLIRFLGRTTRVAHLIDEIVNDTMLVVWRKARTFNRRSKVSTWILGIASRRRLKALRTGEDCPGAVDVDEMAESGGMRTRRAVHAAGSAAATERCASTRCPRSSAGS